MIHLIYESQAHSSFEQADVVSILEHARQRNPAEGITGLLIYHEGTFLQVLEGEEKDVEACFARISRDPRHDEIWELARMDAYQRSFHTWSAGMAGVDDIPIEGRHYLQDFDGIRTRLRDMRERRPEGAAAYTARVFRSFLRQIENPGWT